MVPQKARTRAHTSEIGVRDRLLGAADRLFYREGVRAVGIDRVLAEAAAAKAAGLRFYHIPFNGQSPSTAAADQFLTAITTQGSEPAFIHCAGGNRAAAMWLIKRLVVDQWDMDRASKEATALGLTSPALKQFAADYAQAHKR